MQRILRAGHSRWIDALDPHVGKARQHAFVDRDRERGMAILNRRLADHDLALKVSATRVEPPNLPGDRLRIQPHLRFGPVRHEQRVKLGSRPRAIPAPGDRQLPDLRSTGDAHRDAGKVGRLRGKFKLHGRPVIAAPREAFARDPLELRSHDVGDRQAAPCFVHRVHHATRKRIAAYGNHGAWSPLDVVGQRHLLSIGVLDSSRHDASPVVAAVQIELPKPVPILNPPARVKPIAGVQLERARTSALLNPGVPVIRTESRSHSAASRAERRAARGATWRTGAKNEGAAELERPRTIFERRGSDFVGGGRLPHQHPRHRAVFEVVRKDQVELRAERLLDGQMLGVADVLGHELEVRCANANRVEADKLSCEAQDIGRRGAGGEIVGPALRRQIVGPASDDQRLKLALAEWRYRAEVGFDAICGAADPDGDVVFADACIADNVERRDKSIRRANRSRLSRRRYARPHLHPAIVDDADSAFQRWRVDGAAKPEIWNEFDGAGAVVDQDWIGDGKADLESRARQPGRQRRLIRAARGGRQRVYQLQDASYRFGVRVGRDLDLPLERRRSIRFPPGQVGAELAVQAAGHVDEDVARGDRQAVSGDLATKWQPAVDADASAIDRSSELRER